MIEVGQMYRNTNIDDQVVTITEPADEPVRSYDLDGRVTREEPVWVTDYSGETVFFPESVLLDADSVWELVEAE